MEHLSEEEDYVDVEIGEEGGVLGSGRWGDGGGGSLENSEDPASPTNKCLRGALLTVTGSMPVVGSSRYTILGLPSRAIAIERRRRMPPEYEPEDVVRELSRLTSFRRRSTSS